MCHAEWWVSVGRGSHPADVMRGEGWGSQCCLYQYHLNEVTGLSSWSHRNLQQDPVLQLGSIHRHYMQPLVCCWTAASGPLRAVLTQGRWPCCPLFAPTVPWGHLTPVLCTCGVSISCPEHFQNPQVQIEPCLEMFWYSCGVESYSLHWSLLVSFLSLFSTKVYVLWIT